MKKLHGRRKGKKLKPRQSVLVRDLGAQLAIDLSQGTIAPTTLFPDGFERLELEIGFGDGARLAQRARVHPEIAFLGCEPYVNGLAKLLSAIDEQGLRNIRIHAGDARDLLEALPDEILDLSEILYPDPWPKRRQLKRRLISDEFLTLLAQKMKSDAPLRFASDIDCYSAWTLTRALRSDDFVWPAQSPQDWLHPWADWTPTRFEKKARREGRASAYLTFLRRPRVCAASG